MKASEDFTHSSAMPGPDFRADEAVKCVLRNSLQSMQANETGVKANLDAECLHDYRIAVRRTRTVLRQIKGVFPEAVGRRYLREFAGLSEVTGAARDLDVYLLEFDRYRALLPETLHAGLDALYGLVDGRAAKAHEALTAYLESAPYLKLLENWEAFLNKPCPQRPRSPNALLPIGEAAGRRVRKLHRRMLDEGRAITPAAAAEQFHELRKTGKKLRYLMECFRSLYPEEDIKPSIKALKRLQDYLGALQDSHVQIENLKQCAEALRQDGATTATLLALGALLDRLQHRETALRLEFPDRFAEFSKQRRFRRFLSH
jgi:CHAD domain-containing protein